MYKQILKGLVRIIFPDKDNTTILDTTAQAVVLFLKNMSFCYGWEQNTVPLEHFPYGLMKSRARMLNSSPDLWIARTITVSTTSIDT